jgi:hypothetical protein
MLQKSLKTLLLVLAAVFLLGLLIETRLAIATMLVTFFLGLAIAGPSKWLSLTVALVMTGVFAITAVYLLAAWSNGGILAGLIGFGILPLAPALFLWMACLIRRRND